MENTSSEHLSANAPGSFRAVCASSLSLPTILSALEKGGFKAYILESTGVHDKNTLISALVNCFHISDRVGSGRYSWDATSDLLWQVLMERPEKRVVILWGDAHRMVADQLQLFLDGLELLHSLGDVLAGQESSVDCHPVLLRIVVLGEGVSFPLWQ